MKICINKLAILVLVISTSSAKIKYDPTIPGEELPAIYESYWALDCILAHNFFRSMYVDARTNIPLSNFSWSDKLARSAKQFAHEKLNQKPLPGQTMDVSDHKSNNPYGENMAGGSFSWRSNWRCAAGVNRYHEEKKYYDNLVNEFHSTNPGEFWKYKSPPKTLNYTWSHYTQLLWINSTSMGCGYAQNDVKRIEICHYEPSGNFAGVVNEVKLKKAKS